MKLEQRTIDILRNFATINQSIIIENGKTLRTMAEVKNIIAEAEVPNEFLNEMAIYDLGEFLASLNVVDEPEISIGDKYVTIEGSGGRAKVKYFLTNREMLTDPLQIKMPSSEVKFTLDKVTRNKLSKAAAAFGHSEILVTAVDGTVRLSVADREDETSNSFSIDVPGEVEHDNFLFVLNMENLKMIDGSYDVEISRSLISQFKHQELPLTYWVAVEKSSNYGV